MPELIALLIKHRDELLAERSALAKQLFDTLRTNRKLKTENQQLRADLNDAILMLSDE